MKIFCRLTYLATIYFNIVKFIAGEKTFAASFQANITGAHTASSTTWAHFAKPMKGSREFTACHWIQVKFFNRDIAACLWSYCTIENKDDQMECVQMSLHGVVDTANRNLEIHAHMSHWTIIALESFHHRTWNHLCWSFSVLTGNSTFYHNGDLMKSIQVSKIKI